MTKKLLVLLILLIAAGHIYSQTAGCTIDITRPANDTIICLGDSVYLQSEGSCDVFLNNGFEGGLGVGWSQANANPEFLDRGCAEEYRPSGEGPEGLYLWIGTNAAAERSIVTDSFDITIGNCSVKFWMRYGRADNAGTCEDPNSPNEGVHLQYSTDNGGTWIDFPGNDQFPEGPNLNNKPFITTKEGSGGYWTPAPYCSWPMNNHCDERYDTNATFWWHEYNCVIPAVAETSATRFRFIQNDNQQNYDSWGLDEVKIFCSNNQNVIWGHGPTVFNPTTPVSPTDTTQYWVMVYDTAGNFATDTVTIYVANTPVIDLGPDTTICWDGTNAAYFDAGIGFETYLWNTGDTTHFITPDTSGTYIVEVWNATCYDTDTINLTAIPATGAWAGTDESVCQGDAFDFNNSATVPTVLSADSILWFGGIGTFVDPGDTVPVYYTDITELGPVALGMIAYGSGPCGNDTSYMTLTVDTVPIIDYASTPIDTACVMEPYQFNGISNCQIVSWDWDFGDGGTGTGQSPVYAYANTGIYDVELSVVNAWGCIDTIDYERVVVDPYFYFTHLPDSSCQGDTVFFAGLGDAITYTDWIWDFGDGTPQDTGKNVSHVFSNYGIYSITLTVCNQDTTLEHTVIQPCLAFAGTDEQLCEYHSFNFATSATPPDTISGDSLLWYGGIGSFDDPTQLWPVYTPDPAEIGDILMTLVVYGKGTCINDTSTMILSVLDGPEAGYTIIPPDSICVGEDIVFTDTSTTTIVDWQWDFDDGNTGTGSVITHSYLAAGFYDVQLIVTNDTNCVDSVTHTIEVHPLPDAGFTITPSDTVCLNTLMTFDDTTNTSTGAILYQIWNLGDGTIDTAASISHTYADTGTYNVFLYILNENSCADTMMQEVTVMPLPACDFTMSPNDTNCTNEIITFSAIDTSGTTITSWEWDFGDGNTATGQIVTHSYSLENDYLIRLVATNTTGCTDTSWHTRFIDEIDINFDITPLVSCLGDVVSFDGTGDTITFTTWEWDFGDGNTDIGRNVTHTYATYDTFNITLIVCSDTIVQSHIVQEPASAYAGSDESICEDFSFYLGSSASLPTFNAIDSLKWLTSGDGFFTDNTVLLPVYHPGPTDVGTTIELSLVALARVPCANDTSSMFLTIFDGPEATFTLTPPDSICENEWISLDANSSTTITDWDWDFGDGSTGVGQNTGYAWSNAGLYDITLVVTNSAGCYDTTFDNIEVHPLPIAGFDVFPNDSICMLEELTFVDTTNTNTGTIQTWFWDFGDGSTSIQQNPTHTYSSTGTFNVSLYVYNENSCRDTITKQVEIFTLPACDFSMSPNDTNCVNEEVTFVGVDTSGNTIVDWAWDFGDGNTGNGQTVTHTYTDAGGGDYLVRLIVTTNTGCYDTVYHTRTLVDLSSLDFTQSPDTTTCLGETTWFSGNTTATFTEWFWDFGDGNTAIGPNVSHVYATSDTFDVTLTVCSETVVHQHIVVEPAQADAGSDEGMCSGYTFDLSTSATQPSVLSIDSLRWFTGGTGTFDDPTTIWPIYTPAITTGSVTLTLVAYGITPCSNDTSTMTLTITETPQATITPTPADSLCVDEWITLDGTANIAINNWIWDLGDGGTANTASTGNAYNPAGIYTVTLIAEVSGGCADTTSIQLDIHELPVAGFDVFPNDSICMLEELTFVDTTDNSTGTITQWFWDFGDGNTSAIPGGTVTHSYNATGTYNVSLYVYNENSCRDTITKQVEIFTLPACDFTMGPNDTNCVNELITFTGIDTSGTTIQDWAWDFGDGIGTANGQTVNYAYTAGGTYTITLVVMNSTGCYDTIQHIREVVDLTSLDFSQVADSIICLGDTVWFVPNMSATFTDWLWDFGDGNTSTLESPWHVYTSSNIYTVTLSVCSETVVHSQEVVEPVVVDAGSDEGVCSGYTFDFANSLVQPSANFNSALQWYSSGGGTFTGANSLLPTYTPTISSGTDTLFLIAFGNAPCADDTAYMLLTVTETPIADITTVPPDSLCVDEWITFNGSANITINNWLWDLGDGSTGSGSSVNHSYGMAGNYLIQLIAEVSGGCADTTYRNIDVFPLPVAGFEVTPGNGICRMEQLTFTDTTNQGTGTVLERYWDFGDGSTAQGTPVQHTYTTAGNYTVTMHVYNENSCRDTITQTVSIFELPNCDFTISPTDTTCINETVSFSGTDNSGTAIVAWDWDFGDGSTGSNQNVTHMYTAPALYTIRLIATNANGCLDTMYHQHEVVDPAITVPPTDFTSDVITSCEGDLVSFTAIGPLNHTDYTWDFGDGGTAIGRNVSHIFNIPATDPVTYTVTMTYCTFSISHDILVNPVPQAFAGAGITSCQEVPIPLGDLPVPPSVVNAPSQYWYGGTGSFDFPNQLHPTYTPAPGELGPVTLYLVANGIPPCLADTSSVTINIIEGASADAGSDEHSCQGDPWDFSNSADQPNAYAQTSILWTGGAGFFVDPTAEIPVYVPDPNELGPVVLTMFVNNIINCDSVDQMVLTIHPVYEFTQNHTICFNDTLILPGGGWANTTGIYYDTLQSVWGCDSVIITDLFVRPQIDADYTIGPRDSACIDDDFIFTRTGAATLISWQWDFGDGNFSNALNPTHSYPAPGVYNVTFSFVDEFGCSDEVTHQAFVYNPPDLDFTASASSACINSEITFYGQSADNIISWDWDFGDGSTGSGQNVSHMYTSYGAVQVTLYVEADNGCQTSLTKYVFVAEPPTADFTYNILSCDTIQFTDLSTSPPGYFITEWDWDFDDGNTSNLQHPAHSYATGGIYNVKLVITSDSSGMLCQDSITMPIVVPDRPTVYFSWTPEPTCLGDPTSFFATSGNPITEWYWDFNDGNFSYIQNPVHTYADTGVYNVMLMAKDINGCWDTVTHDVTVSGIPDISISANPMPGCVDEQINFYSTSGVTINSYLWDFGDGGQSVDANPIHVYTAAGTYTVTLWVSDSNNCFNSTSMIVDVNPMPLPDFTHSGTTCSGDTIFFYNQSVSPNGQIIEWVWDFGDGNSVTIQAPDDPDVFHIYGGGGTFNVTLSVLDADSCVNSVTKPVNITAGPIADFNYEPNCSGEPVEFTDISSSNNGSVIVSWYWEFDDPASGILNTSTLQDPTHLFTSAGTFNVLLLVTNVEGCTDTVVHPVNVDQAPDVSFTTDSDTACVETDLNFYGNANTSVSWSWDFGDGGTSVLQDPVHQYADPGTYLVTVTVEDGNGCTASYSSNVYVNPLPLADFTFSTLLCSGAPVEFTDLSSPMNAYMTQWHWYFGDGTDTVLYFPASGDISHTYDSPGNYTVSLAIINSNGCEDSVTYAVAVIQGPEAAFEATGDVCEGGTVEFIDLSQGMGGVIQSWFWTFGDPASGGNNTSSMQNPTHVYSTAGSYVVTLTVTSNTGCQSTTSDTVEVAPPPSLDWYTDPDTTCHGSPVYFYVDTDTTNVAEVITYSWSFGDPTSGINDTSNVMNPTHLFTSPGVYTVTLTITNIDGCQNTRLHNIEVESPPVADYEYEQACLDDSTLFTDMTISTSSAITEWMWDFGDPASGANNTSTLQNTGHVFSALGTYNVQLIAFDEMGCSDTIVKTIEVGYAPIAFFEYIQPCDPPGFVYFNDSSWTQPGAPPIMEWLWELEPGYFSSEINPTYTFEEFDTCYVVHLTVTDANGCENTITDSICVVPPLIGGFEATRVCHDDSTLFTPYYEPADDSILMYSWNMGDGNVVITQSDSLYYTFAEPGTYYVVLTMENQNGCEQSIMHPVNVDAKPGVNFEFTPAFCDEITLFNDLTDPGAGAIIESWAWNFGDPASANNTSDLQNPQHQYAAIDSSYLVSLVVTNSHGCVDSLQQTLEKGLCMQAIFEVASETVCRNQEVCFADSSYIVGDSYAIHTWQWAMGDGQWIEYNNYQDTICHSYEQWGEYRVMLVITTTIGADIYSDTTYRMVKVSPPPAADMIAQAPCAENPTSFFDLSGDNGVEVNTWAWDFGDPNNANDTSSLQNPTYIYYDPGTYTTQLIVGNINGCSDTITIDVEVFNNPEASFFSSLSCVGGMTEFTDSTLAAEGAIEYWLWDFGTGETSSMQHARYVFADTGNYLVQMVVTDEHLCKDTAREMLRVYPVPYSNFEIIDAYEQIQGQILLDNLSQAAINYLWDFGNGDTSELFSPVVRYEEDGTYLVQLISWNENNCPDTTYMEYTIEFMGLWVPTAFQPSSLDDKLNLFKPAGLGLIQYEIVIINERGNVVFSSRKLDLNGSPLEGWDGTTNGEQQPTGNYMWSISAQFEDGSVWQGNDLMNGDKLRTFGKVLLIR